MPYPTGIFMLPDLPPLGMLLNLMRSAREHFAVSLDL